MTRKITTIYTLTESQSCSPSVCAVSNPTSMELRSTIAAREPLKIFKKKKSNEKKSTKENFKKVNKKEANAKH